MSAYKKIQCSFTNKDMLLKALTELGIKHQVHASPVDLINSYHASVVRAEIVASRESMRSAGLSVYGDVGFEWNQTAGQYDVHITDDHQHKITNKITQAYAKCTIETALAQNRFTQIKSTIVSANAKQTIQITASKVI